MSTAWKKGVRSILAVAVATVLAGPALGASPARSPLISSPRASTVPDAACRVGGPIGPDRNGEAVPFGSILPEGECFEVLHGDWVCVEHWVFGCLQAHCVYPGTECSLYVPIPCPGEGSGGAGNERKLDPSL
jgi:hypothetical protein